MNRLLLIFVLIVASIASSEAFFSWLFGLKNSNRDEEATQPEKGGLLTSKTVPFDMKTTDDSFLASAQLSTLDTCHHNTISTIQGTCSALSEEDMGKLAVQLLNCQLDAEGRTTFKCTNDMTIAECTATMDSTSWNAYQIVTNRALAVCYATRQQQFRLKTEYTVNQLVHSTQQQLQAMEELQDGQKKVSEAATDMLDTVTSGQQQLMSRQEALKAQQLDVHSRLSGNIRELVKEKALIAAGNHELASLTESMKKKIDNATFQLSEQGQMQKKNHQEILGDLMEIRNRAAEVWQKIDNSSQRVLEIQLQTQQQYEQTMKNLEQVNATVAFVVTAIRDMESLIEAKINSIAGLIGGTGEDVALVSTIVLHVLYFLVAAVSAAFLHTPLFSRLVLLLLVPLNAWVAIHRGESLGFAAMTMLILLTVAANWLISWLYYIFNFRTTRHLAIGVGPFSPASNKSTSFSAETGPSTPSNDPQSSGANGADIQRLLTVLDDLYKSGALTPAAVMSRCSSPAVPPPLAQPSCTRVSDVSLNAATPAYPPPTPLSQQHSSFMNEPKEDNARRHLLRYLDNNTSLRYSPTPSRTSTPSKRSACRSSMSRESVLSNQSSQKPLCLATTKLGKPCRNSSISGSAFCQRHQV